VAPSGMMRTDSAMGDPRLGLLSKVVKLHQSVSECLVYATVGHVMKFASGDPEMSLTRREMCLLLPGLLPVAGALQASAVGNSLPSGAFSLDKMPLHIANNNAQIRGVMRGKLATGEGIEVHETTLPPGGAPTASTHHHAHSEMWLLREGTIELTVNGKTYPLNAGSVGFSASNEEHGIRNIGTVPAIYFLVAIGPGAELQE
jgi:mannose-6-phosphate isomerase-like protein (cupin superfamily)